MQRLDLLGPFGVGKTTLLKEVNRRNYPRGVLSPSQAIGRIAGDSIEGRSSMQYHIINNILKASVDLSGKMRMWPLDTLLRPVSNELLLGGISKRIVSEEYNAFSEKVVELVQASGKDPIMKLRKLSQYYEMIERSAVVDNSALEAYVLFDESMPSIILRMADYCDDWKDLLNVLPLPHTLFQLNIDPDSLAVRRRGRGRYYDLDQNNSAMAEAVRTQVENCAIIAYAMRQRGVNIIKLDMGESLDENSKKITEFIESLNYSE